MLKKRDTRHAFGPRNARVHALLATLAALVCIAIQIVEPIHMVFVPHYRCAEHGELIHEDSDSAISHYELDFIRGRVRQLAVGVSDAQRISHNNTLDAAGVDNAAESMGRAGVQALADMSRADAHDHCVVLAHRVDGALVISTHPDMSIRPFGSIEAIQSERENGDTSARVFAFAPKTSPPEG